MVLRLGGGSSNPLVPSLRAAVMEALAGAECERIVLAGSGATFSSALPSEPDALAPSLAELCGAVATSPVPVIAALHGLVMGPGAELALAARGRIAAPDTRIAFPEVALGVCPEGGTSLRLPQRIGARPALELLLSGRAVSTDEALALGLVDAVADDPLALALTRAVPAGSAPRSAVEALASIGDARRAHSNALPAMSRIIGCVEAGVLLPPEAHRAFEIVTREDLEATPEARALRAAVRAERLGASLPPAVARLRPVAVQRIALNGAAPALVTLARVALARGLAVDWRHASATERAASLAALDLAEEDDQRAGRLTAQARSAGRARLSEIEGRGSDALVQVHAGPPDPGVLRDGIGITHLVLDGAEGELGLALAPSLRASELAVLAEEAPDSIALAVATLRRIGLPPVLVGRRPILGRRVMAAGDTALAQLTRSGVPPRILAEALEAFGARLPAGLPEAGSTLRQMPASEIVGRWLAALANEALRLLDQGVARRPSDVDHLLIAGYHFPRWRGGPMHQADRRGLMVLRHDLRSWAGEHPIWAPAPLLDRLIQDGLRLPVLDA